MEETKRTAGSDLSGGGLPRRVRQRVGGLEGCDILLVGGETRVPAVRQVVQAIFKGRPHTDVNTDEVVALGASVQAGIIQHHAAMKSIVLVDTTALPLGTAVEGGVFSPVIEANTRIPCTRTNEYVPVADYQRSVVVEVYQGESELCRNNVKLGEFALILEPPRLRARAAILLTFSLDADDILHVSATDKFTGARPMHYPQVRVWRTGF